MQKKLINSTITRAKKKDPEAELALIKLFEPLMLSMGRRYTFENRIKDDFIQEGAVVLLEAIKTYDQDRGVPFAAYLKDQMFYHYVEDAKHFRFTDSLDAPVGDNDLCLLDTLPLPVDDIDPLITTELYDLLKKCLDQLRSRQRWLIIEYYYQKRTIKDLAKELKISPSALSHYHRRTLAKLRQLLNDHGITWDNNPFY